MAHKGARDDLTAEYVRSILDYDPETGVFRWRWRADVPKEWNTRYAGKIAGAFRSDSKTIIRIFKIGYLAHRLAYLIQIGAWPPEQIDHRIDGADNRWNNLRAATPKQNMQNRGVRRNNTSGYVGIYFDKSRNKWSVFVGRKSIGRFCTISEAFATRRKATVLIKGEFAHPDELNHTD